MPRVTRPKAAVRSRLSAAAASLSDCSLYLIALQTPGNERRHVKRGSDRPRLSVRD